jgi:hypothetical protein
MTSRSIAPRMGADAVGWRFPSLNDGTQEGFNVAALDMFKSERLQALVREMIQNSLDARHDPNRPVEVRFTLHDESDLDSAGFTELNAYLVAARDVEHNEDAKAFYQNAIDQITKGKVVMLGVHDYNTMGLTGPTYNPVDAPTSGKWLALVKSAGMTFKDSPSALGSFGHGSRAPFAMSELRTLFYFTRINTDDGLEARFQGRSILQSVPLLGITGEAEWSANTGYFGRREKCMPLCNEDVPEWATAARPEPDPSQLSIGTSIFIPEPFEVAEPARFWAQVKLAVVANFYYAVLRDNLVVYLGNEVIDRACVAQAFDDTDILIEDLDPTDKVLERFESARTVRHAAKPEQMDIEGFGVVEWCVRFDGVTTRRVGVARGNGMLITRRAEKLQVFPGTRPFDLFVCVVGEAGSEILRKLENPEHTEFSADRINNPEERHRVERAYRQFTEGVRSLVKELAVVEAVDSVDVDDLDDFFRENWGVGNPSDAGEPSRALKVVSRTKEPHRENRPSDAPGSEVDGGHGRPSNSERRDGSGPGGDGRNRGSGSGGGSLTSGMPVRNLRIVRDLGKPGRAVVSFTPVDGTRHTLVLLRSGESESERLEFGTDEDVSVGAPWRDELSLTDLGATARKTLVLNFHPEDLEFAIEGWLMP